MAIFANRALNDLTRHEINDRWQRRACLQVWCESHGNRRTRSGRRFATLHDEALRVFGKRVPHRLSAIGFRVLERRVTSVVKSLRSASDKRKTFGTSGNVYKRSFSMGAVLIMRSLTV